MIAEVVVDGAAVEALREVSLAEFNYMLTCLCNLSVMFESRESK